ncbi:DUF599 domain-containing protein [Pseudaestuariivita atlantica]|uniref:Membrane protein n=1 Tax=Pseudaestuariivita atlantica TaxID=1317121 RepID=A0A0L1JQ42_9RHOB|nr:DUF599 domain-containing protein [Pseudaestuariivita atlantica]KNG93856.1 membrane protein [Pseudaestuariivita atlantica]
MSFVDHIELFSVFDAVAVAILFAAWWGVGWVVEREATAFPSVSVLMDGYRREWMVQLVTRNPRIFDAQIITNLRQGSAFFGSATMLAMGGGLALIGNVEMIAGIARDLTFDDVPRVVWQIKLLAGLVLLGHAFLRFVWSNRLFGYAAVMMAAVPNDTTDPTVPARTHKSAELTISASRAFNQGLRSVYFALASAAWLVGPLALIGTVLFTLWVIWRREYASRSRAVLAGADTSS